MYLKSVVISGFKSFPHKTLIKLHPGINCIIGPNGCGKSNIIDAIRWALGESKLSLLRAKAMEELIFHGTERRPQRGVAEVFLNFVNDGVLPMKSSEVMISRKLTRSGDNEFNINDKRVLQREVIELFEAVNPQGYSLLSREEIDSVLSGDPYYRRRTVEEVAGIATYRNHKLSTLSRIERMKADLEKLGNVIDEVSSREVKLRSEARRAARYEDLKREVAHIRWLLLKDMNEYIEENTERISRLKVKENNLIVQVNNLEKLKESIVGRRKEQEERGREIGNKILMLEKKESSLKEKRENLKQQLDEIIEQKEKVLKDLIGIGNERKGIDDKCKAIKDLIESKTKELACYPEIDKSIYEERDKVTKEIEDLKEQSASVRENLVVTRTMIENSKKKKSEARDEMKRIKNIRKAHEKELNETQELYKNLKPPVADIGSIENSLQRMEEERARLYIYLKDSTTEEGFVRLGDIITPKKGNERIVYGALGSLLSCIIVKDLKDILFQDSKRREYLFGDLLPMIDTDKKYEDLYSYVVLDDGYMELEPVLHMFVVTSDIESAMSLRKKGVTLPIVTHKGELLTNYGTLEVGDPEIKISKSRLERELEKVEEGIKENRELLDKINNEKLAYQNKRVSLDMRIKELKRNINEIDGRLDKLSTEMAGDLKIDTKSSEKTLAHLTELIREKEKVKEKFERDINDMDRIVEARKNQELEIAKLGNEFKFLKKELDNYDGNLKILRGSLTGITEKERSIKRNFDEVTDTYKDITKELSNLKKATEEYTDIEIREGITDIFQIEAKIGENRNSLDSIREERHTLEIGVARLETKTKELEDRGVLEPDRLYEIDDLNETLRIYENKLQSMLPVNPFAIREHEEIQKRLKFLKGEKRDIVRTMQIIEDTIKLLDEQARSKVREALSMINERFNYIFRLLFSGGEARLLMDEGDPLIANIDIGVSPKGKKLRRIEQLSTGERTLSVIALFFGVYELKPTPFMILDEVDAPLDDANLSRFLSLIKKRSEDTQYILITHNKQTMESANYLYGVTMEEPGVSKLVSVRLRE